VIPRPRSYTTTKCE